VLRQRYEATEGARKLAAESLERAAAKTAEYATAMRAARTEIYQAQEQAHKRLQEGELAELAWPVGVPKRPWRRPSRAFERRGSRQDRTGGDSEVLANQITESILRGSAA